ncbi:MAG: DUF1080 domain-containing protein [Lentisphaeria bacterium]|nr:DUF1080 domain-containing protein [Lentisphaeria bacterium]
MANGSRWILAGSMAMALGILKAAGQVPGEEEFVPLFDGHSLAGWEGNGEVFRIREGAIVGGSLDGPVARNEFLCSTTTYADFELRLDFKLLGRGANAGIQIRSRRLPEHHEMIGYQADLGDGWWGCLYDESRRRRILAGPPPDQRAGPIRPEDWNDYRIRCEGRRVQLWVNGTRTVDYSEADESLVQEGVIALQIHGGPPSEAWYRNVRIRELRPPPLGLALAPAVVPRYGRVTFDIPCEETFRNPFAPREVTLDLEIRAPGGRVIGVPAFWYEPCERRTVDAGGRVRDWVALDGPGRWQARFAPAEVGRYDVRALLRCGAGQARSSESVSFRCTPRDHDGYVRVSGNDSRFFELDSGRPFFPIGQNLAFLGPSQYVTPSRMEVILGRLAENGANTLRVWVCCSDWAVAVESRKSAWGRSWGPKPTLSEVPGDGPDTPSVPCVTLAGADGSLFRVDPSHPVAVRPDAAYVLSGRVRLRGEARGVAIELGGVPLGEAAVGREPGAWVSFSREVPARAGRWFLEGLALRLLGAGEIQVRELGLRQAGGGPDLLWEADPGRPVRGVYNPVDCFLVDHLVETAEEHGIRLQLCLLNRDLYMDAMKHEDALEYTLATESARDLLRYAVARWGCSTSVAVWEYWNEQNPGLPCGRFYRELGEYLAAIDPYRHLRATSAWGPAPRDWQHPELDVADLHWYLRPNWNELWKDAAAAALDRARFLRGEAPSKPALLSEFGLAGEKWERSPHMREDTALHHFHDALWASALSGLSGTAMFWWWEELDRMDAYAQYRPLAAYVADIPWTRSRLRAAAATTSDPAIRTTGLQGDAGVYLWLNDSRASWHRMVVEKAEAATVEGLEVTIEGVRPGSQRVAWWNTNTGQADVVEAECPQDGRLVLRVPPFRRDTAVKVEPR